jgi:hypothetical protein
MDGRDFEMNTSECEMSGERQNAQTARLGGEHLNFCANPISAVLSVNGLNLGLNAESEIPTKE